MVSLSWLKDGLVFTSAKFFKHQGAYTCVPQRPGICDKCDSRSGRFHAHGRYQRSLSTLKDQCLKTIKICKHRWLCLCCGRTMSNGSEDILAYKQNCTLVVVALLWAYLESGKGLHNCIPQKLYQAASPKTLWRYFKQAKTVCRQTQQAIREVLIEVTEPRPWDDCFFHGLSPPEGFFKWHRDAPETGALWRTLIRLRRTAYWIKKPFQSALCPHGPGKNRSTTQALTIPAVILSKILRKGNRDFYPFFGPIF